ncbi:MAG: class IV lanthionine synthetase LanL [Pseudonocardia sp.]
MADFNLSVFPGSSGTETTGTVLTEVLENALDAAGGATRWHVATDGFWSSLTPEGHPRRAQGWKLHLSATPASAEAVLTRALSVLFEAGSAFKFAATIEHVAHLNARHTPRGHSGKFLTVYPHSDEEAARLAESLHRATTGLPGPRILSDRPYAPESLVHYRYGAFVEDRRLGNDGLYAWVILDPDGNPVEDRRVGQYLPPAWAPCPFPQPQVSAGSGAKDGGILLDDRFLVREAIRHVNKGGVYRAVDTETGAEAIIKEARPHVGADVTGRDVRDLLRAEARALERLGPLGVAPRLLGLFEQSGHLFLAEEFVPGVALRQWVLDRIRGGGWRRRIPDAMQTAERLVELLDLAHRAGVILRDFTPNNVMVQPDGQLRLIDLELAVLSGQQEDELTGAGTHGYAPPEQMAGARATVGADYYSLGGNICFVLTGSTPDFLDDLPVTRSLRERLAGWLAVRGAAELPAEIQTLLLGLMDSDPERRWTTAAARDTLAMARTTGHAAEALSPISDGFGSDAGRLSDEQWCHAVDGIVGYLLDSMNRADPERLWPASCAQGAPDPCVLQLGAAGVLGVLTRCFELTGDERLPAAIATTGSWITQRVRADAQRPPGLYFGEAGIAWSLYEAGRALGDDQLAEHGLAMAAGLPVSSPNPDVTHGTAGIGLTTLHLGLRSDNAEFLQRAGESADTLLTLADDGPDGLIWGTPAAFESRLAGGRYYGFAHGTAGVGYFLLATALATGRSDCLELARQAGETLLSTAIVSDGVALWGPGPGDETTAPYWCHGSAGIGAFLTRLHRATGDDRFDKVAQMSATAVMENSWRGVLGQCHGLAGNGEFLLDMAETVDGRRYEDMAHQVGRVIFASRALRDGQMVFPDEDRSVSAMWADGLSGILSFLLRLRHRSPRLWMVDSLLEWGPRT